MLREEQTKLLKQVWHYPLFEALSRRRSRRFGLGYHNPDARFQFKSEKTPVPLTELETALLCWAAHGITGTSLFDQDNSKGTYVAAMSFAGRTHPNPCNDQHFDLLVINDDGMFFYRPTKVSKPVEIEGPDDYEKILKMYREETVKVSEIRPSFPNAALFPSNEWAANKPGSTLFFPIVDITEELINIYLLTLGRVEHETCYQFIDEATGKPAGTQKWIDSGYCKGPRVSFQSFERLIAGGMTGIAHYMVQNINLAAEAMGLGELTWGGYISLVIMGGTPLTRGLGFRFVTGKDKMPTPVGIDGVLEGLCPPYCKEMSAAVDDIINIKYGPEGLFSPEYTGPSPYKDRKITLKNPHPTEEAVECTKALCNYICETYGRFPASVDAMEINVASTVHHLDIDFYDRFFPPELLSKEQREHMKIWH